MKDLLHKYHKKLTIESYIFSSMYGFLIGTITALIVSIILYINKIPGVAIILITWILLSIIATIIIKLTIFNKTYKDTAKRLDEQLQLEERMITMVEYEDTDTVMTNRQRSNAKEVLNKITLNQFKFKNILKPLIVISVLFLITTTTVILTSVEVHSYLEDINNVELSPEDQIIENLISELRDIVDEAPIEESLKTELHEIINKLQEEYKQDTTLNQKIARVEDTRREIIEAIENALQDETTIIDELKKHSSTENLGHAFDSNDQEIITSTIDEMITEFLSLDIDGMTSYVDTLASDIETSVNDASIENQELEQELQDIIDLLLSLIPKLDGQDPQDSADELQEILEELAESLTESEEQTAQEEMEQAIEEALEELQGEQPEPEEPEPEELPEETEGPEGHEDDGSGSGDPLDNPLIIDGETEFNQELYDQIRLEMIDMIENGLITEEDIIILVNNYMENIDTSENE